MKSIALVDPHAGGHHEWYLEVFAIALSDLGWRVCLVSPQAEAVADKVGRAEVCGISWSPTAEKLRTRWIAGCRGLWHSAHAAVGVAERRMRSPIDVCFLAWMDSWFGRGQRRGAVYRAFPRPFVGLVFQPWMFRIRGRAPWLRHRSLDPHEPLHARNCLGVAVLDQRVAPRLSARLGRRVTVFPDVPCLDRELSTPVVDTLRNAASGRAVVLLTGVVDGRKGVGTFLRAMEAADPHAWFFAVAGPVAWSKLGETDRRGLRNLLDGPRRHAAVITLDSLSEKALNALIVESSLLWLSYEGFAFGSNLLSKAAAFRRPVLSNGEHLIGESVLQHALGLVAGNDCERRDVFSAEGRDRVVAHSKSEAFAAGAARYHDLNSRERLGRAFAELLGVAPRAIEALEMSP